MRWYRSRRESGWLYWLAIVVAWGAIELAFGMILLGWFMGPYR